MKRAVAVALVTLVTASAAMAARPATPAERAAIMAAAANIGLSSGPAACNDPTIEISTWDPTYATWQPHVWTQGPCANYSGAGDGLNFFRKAFEVWLYLTHSGGTPVCGSYVPNVPFSVLADFLECPGGPQKAQCFTVHGPQVQTENAGDASFNVGVLLKSCYPDYDEIADLGFTALPRAKGKIVSLIVKTEFPPGKEASIQQARTICQHASIVAKWLQYYNFTVAVLAGEPVLHGPQDVLLSHATWVTNHVHPC